MEITKDLIEYDITTAAIEEMKKKYSGMKITDAKSDKAVRAARTFMVSKRTAVEKRRVELNASANEWRKKVNDKAKEITALLLPIEESLQAEVKRVDDEIKAKREEEDRQERERIEAIQVQISSIRSLGVLHNMPSSKIKEYLGRIQDMKISEDTYMEFVEQAIQVQWETITTLKEIFADRLQFEKEEAERKAEGERLEKVHKEQEEAQKIIEEANRKIEEEKAKIAAEKEAEAKHREREEFERQVKIQAEKEALEKAAKAESDRIEVLKAEAKEKERQEALRPDKEKLIKFGNDLLTVDIPSVTSAKAKQIIFKANSRVNDLVADIKEQASKL